MGDPENTILLLDPAPQSAPAPLQPRNFHRGGSPDRFLEEEEEEKGKWKGEGEGGQAQGLPGVWLAALRARAKEVRLGSSSAERPPSFVNSKVNGFN